MIDLTKKALPNVINIKGVPFVIKTDYRLWLRFMIDFQKLTDKKATLEVGYLFDGECPRACSYLDLLQFAAPKNELPRPIDTTDAITLDYELDSDLIYAAFLGQYGIDLVDIEYLHWHKFLALIAGLNEDTRLREVMGYRCYKKSNRKPEEQYERLKLAWQIERETEYQDEELDAFSALFTRTDEGQTEP